MSFPSYVDDHKNQEHYVDTFATTYTGNQSTTISNVGRPVGQRWNTALRVLTCVFTLIAVLCTIFAKATDRFGFSLTYTSTSANVFFMVVNAVVCGYCVVLSVIALVMWINESSTTPSSLLMMILVLDVVCLVFLLLGFASALATEIISRDGFWVSNEDDQATVSTGICYNYGSFCRVFEVALGFCGTAIITFTAGTAIDGFYLHLRRA